MIHGIIGIAQVTSLKILGVTFTDTLSVSVFLYTWTMWSTLLRGPCTRFASCGLTGCRRLLCNRCSALLSSRNSPMPLSPAWWGFTTSTDRQRIDFLLRANKSGFWTLAVPSDFPTFEYLCYSAQQPTTNFLRKLLHSRTTSTCYMHFFHHDPQHHNDTALDGVHTLFSSLDTPPVFLIVIFLPVCYLTLILVFVYCLIVVHC